jgi:hypothetical protein
VYDYWSKASYWSLDEATALLLERNPNRINLTFVRQDPKRSSFGLKYRSLHELLRRAAVARQIRSSTNPGSLIAWAKHNRIEVPEALEAAVRRQGHQVADWKAAYDRQAEELASLRERVTRVQGEQSNRLGTRERESLLKLIIGMAVKGYGHDPKASRNTTTKDIAGDLRLIGLPSTRTRSGSISRRPRTCFPAAKPNRMVETEFG